MIFILFLATFFSNVSAEEKVIYKYKTEETLDFSEFSLSGQIIAPADLSLKIREGEEIDFAYPIRKSFDDKIINELREAK